MTNKQVPLDLLLIAHYAIHTARERLLEIPGSDQELYMELGKIESSLSLVTTLTEASLNGDLIKPESPARVEGVFIKALGFMKSKKMIVMSLFAVLALTGCATQSSMKIEGDHCKKTLTCLEDGVRCTKVRLETQGACRMDFVGLNEIY